MKIRNIISSFRANRGRKLTLSNSVSFEDFCNEVPPERYPRLKESSLNSSFDISPVKDRPTNYERFARDEDMEFTSSRPSLATVLLFIILSAVFLILPIIYLLNCFDIIYEHQNIKHNPILSPDSSELNTEVQDAAQLSKPISLPSPPAPDYDQCGLTAHDYRFDCYPEGGADQNSCEARGCCWLSTETKARAKNTSKIRQNIAMPYCFYPPNYNTYKFVNVSETAFGLVAYLQRSYQSGYPNDVEVIQLIVKYETENRLHIKIVDPLNIRYEPAYPELPIVDTAAENLNYIFELDTFKAGFKVVRKSDNATLFDANNFLNFIYADQFLQISSNLPSKYVYGIGEHTSTLLLDVGWSRFTQWNHDAPPSENLNLYGAHSFYLGMENSSNSHGVFLFNSNGQDILLQPAPAITFRAIGGVLDFYFFLGPTPSDVIEQYTDLIGRPYMPPFWGLGFHLCKYGIKTLNATRETMEKNIAAGVPLDTQWNDLDYMNANKDFTYDKDAFNGLPEFVEDLHKRGMHYIPLIDPGVSGSEEAGTYPPYDEGIKLDIFVQNSSGQTFIGKVWNRESTVWPDFTDPNTVDYWTLMLKNFHDEVAFDGAWIDMNEPSNFLSGTADGCPESTLENPPYLPAVDGGVLYYKTLCMTAKQKAGLHYNVHNLYGFTEAIITSFAMAEIRGKRPMVISRSTFAGHGHYAGHWSGDVFSTWDGLRQSIPHLLSFSLYGIPLMGADICGFNYNTTVALCNRWQQLGAFYPFSRNHNTDDGIPQDPVSMGELVVKSTIKALTVRYELLPYLYSLFYRAHVDGDTVARPLFFEFPKDQNTWTVDTEFLWGGGLLIVPVLEIDATSVVGYLPEGIWYNYYTNNSTQSKGENVTLDAPLDTIPVLVRGGYILPQQDAKQTTTASRKTKLKLLVASNEDGEASGELFWDDGDSLNTIEEKLYTLVQFNLQNGTLSSETVQWTGEEPPHLGAITVLGVQKPVSLVKINNLSVNFKFDTINKYLLIDELDISLEQSLVVTWN
ncbi:lysosomal alpha-glucosidase-like [Sitophilus oryzae]|uniref:Lysosomal alpha-glucosidase-like n=1 Tax=Sitophilus oryzae TaxID=7048 RepID=A0A6J2YQE8_SITOR|nr:lysosomal alpha-glucosidase-like [Sitophilus oryzae]